MSLSERFDSPMSRLVVMPVGTTFVLRRHSSFREYAMNERVDAHDGAEAVYAELTRSPCGRASVPGETCAARPP